MSIVTKLDRKGLTLVEIIVAIAILGMIVVSFLSLFSSTFSMVYIMGSKSNAATEVQKIMEILYRDGNTTYIENLSNAIETDEADLGTNYTPGMEIQYNVKTINLLSGESVDQITIVMFYFNGKHFVKLTSPLPNS